MFCTALQVHLIPSGVQEYQYKLRAHFPELSQMLILQVDRRAVQSSRANTSKYRLATEQWRQHGPSADISGIGNKEKTYLL